MQEVAKIEEDVGRGGECMLQIYLHNKKEAEAMILSNVV